MSLDVIALDGQPASESVRAELAAEGRPVLLAFSGGKDSLAAWLALRDSGVQVVPYSMYYVPGLRFVEDAMAHWEDVFGQRIHRYPHASLYRWLNNFVFQAPEYLATIDAARLPSPSYEQIVDLIRKDLGLPEDTWVADGVRAADSIIRRTGFVTNGVKKPKHHKVSVVWDWRVSHVTDRLELAQIELPVDYAWFGRSFDGMDYRFLKPLSENAPDDYQRILDWFPLADLELFRREQFPV